MFTRNPRLTMVVAVALLTTLASLQEVVGQQPVQSVDPAVLARDDFNGTLSLQWDVRQEDPSHVSLTKRPGFLTITTQYGDLIDSRNSAKNVYLTPAPQSFTNIQLTTCIDRFQPQANWNQAGLLCLTDVERLSALKQHSAAILQYREEPTR